MSAFAAAKWEAPDRKFFGHRDCLVRNMSRYNFIAPQAGGRCLDIGCGRGYGFDYLKPKCVACTGLDVSKDFIEEARAQYPGVAFIHHQAESLPFADASFDTITSFEVIEHIQDDHAFLSEIARVAAPGATIAISTPNRIIASGDREKPLNVFHVREYNAREFQALLEKVFADVAIYGQSEGRRSAAAAKGFADSIIGRIPVGIKYLVPHYLQDMLSVTLRPPLKFEDCHFDLNTFDGVHTLYAICRKTEPSPQSSP